MTGRSRSWYERVMQMTFALAVAIGSNFWGARHVETPCHPTAVQVSEQTMTAWGIDGAISAAYPWPTACNIYIVPRAKDVRRQDPGAYCANIVHEIGNINGVPETLDGDGVMGVYLTDAGIPWDCAHWERWRNRHWAPTSGPGPSSG